MDGVMACESPWWGAGELMELGSCSRASVGSPWLTRNGTVARSLVLLPVTALLAIPRHRTRRRPCCYEGPRRSGRLTIIRAARHLSASALRL
jgi:hypothetical protein